MVNRSRNIGTAAESAVVKVLRANGWGNAERPALRGAGRDQGDVTGCPGIVFEVKAGKMYATLGPAVVAEALRQTEVERVNAAADVGILVIARRGRLAPHWWAVVPLSSLADLVGCCADHNRTPFDDPTPVWLELGDLLPILRRAGYGDPL